ncbi:sigma-54 interaction domain-containing protein [Seongchinamella unica]|nr:sigma-54 dependent transcriptional regulator [Seongchinamella unica]
MAYKALILGEDAAGLLQPLQEAGFAVEAIAGVPDCTAEMARLEKMGPVLLCVAARQVEPAIVSQLHGTLDCELILVGDHKAQSRFAGLVARGIGMYLRQPPELKYVSELLEDIHQDAEAASRKGKARQQTVAMDQFGPLYGSSAPMQDMYRFLRRAASSDAVLCIHGESGTGKELVAQAVHAYSAHGAEPFEAINCAAIPTELVESELFGHEKGSFSGAVAEHLGIFERVGQGTLLLDEITEMPHGIQVKLLRVLESGQFRRVGGEVDHSYQARVIAATNRDPHEAVRSGLLREDLFYRLSQLEVRVPPLRERGQDIVALSRLFVARFDEANDRRLTLKKDAERALLNYHWPGNVRQLWNVIQKACTTARRDIGAPDLPLEDDSAAAGGDSQDSVSIPAGFTLRQAEEVLIKSSLARHGGDKQRVADDLGISLRTLYSRLERYSDNAAR